MPERLEARGIVVRQDPQGTVSKIEELEAREFGELPQRPLRHAGAR